MGRPQFTGIGPNPSGLCQCGCGNPAPLAQQSDSRTGIIKGQPLCYIAHHWPPPVRTAYVNPNPSGLCMCGCGEVAPISPRTYSHQGIFKGMPSRYVPGHNRRKSPVEYIIIDRGFETPCWEWQRSKSIQGYGITFVNSIRKPAHITIYERENGPVPDGHELHHRCENRICVNFDHVIPVTKAQHMRITKMANRNRITTTLHRQGPNG